MSFSWFLTGRALFENMWNHVRVVIHPDRNAYLQHLGLVRIMTTQ